MPAQTRKRIRAFRVKDLMISLVPAGSASGGTSIPVDDGPPLPTRITPVAATALLTRKIQALRKLVKPAATIELGVLDRFAMEIGYDVITQALCTEDMPTSRTLPPPVCWRATPGLTLAHFDEVKAECQLTLSTIAQTQETSLAQARQNSDEFVPRLQEAIKQLQGQ